jgi:ABC-type dipeptide/oligopeptide/nickel transport system permease component
MRARLGLDQSLFDQYLSYLNGLIHGDLGQALINQEPVSKIIGNTLPASLELSVIALIAAAIIGLSVGFSGIARPEGSIDLSGRLYGLGTYALPPFWVAMMVQLIFAVSFGLVSCGRPLPPQPSPTRGQRLLFIRQCCFRELAGLAWEHPTPRAPSRNAGAPTEWNIYYRTTAQPASHLARGTTSRPHAVEG